jgi:hypothetical protein
MSSKTLTRRFDPASSKVEELLAFLELARPRTPDELAAVAAEVGRAFDESQELKKMSHPPRLWKKYIEEVLPLTHLAQHFFPGRQDVQCRPILSDSGNHDAIITLPDGAKTTSLFVEFTCAKDGHEDSLRMEVLKDKGRVNLLGRVTHSGTKKTRHHIQVQDEVVFRPRILEKHRRLIIDCLRAKSVKKYSPNHILVVVFDDHAGIRSERDMADLKSYLESEMDLAELNFRGVYLLGSSGKTLSELRLQR